MAEKSPEPALDEPDFEQRAAEGLRRRITDMPEGPLASNGAGEEATSAPQDPVEQAEDVIASNGLRGVGRTNIRHFQLARASLIGARTNGKNGNSKSRPTV